MAFNPKPFPVVVNEQPALLKVANPARVFLEIQNNSAGNITFKIGAPFQEAQTGVQTISFGGLIPTSGAWTLSYGGQVTGSLAYNESSANLQTALQALSNIGSGNCTVAGSFAAGFVVTFAGTLANVAVDTLTVASNTLVDDTNQTSAQQTVSFNAVPTAGAFELGFGGQTSASLPFGISTGTLQSDLNAMSSIDGGVSAVSEVEGGLGFVVTMGAAPLENAPQTNMTVAANTLTADSVVQSEVQTLYCSPAPTFGTYCLSVPGYGTTTPLAFNATAAQIQAALQMVVGEGNVIVVGIGLNTGFALTFQGALADMPIGLVGVTNNGLCSNDLNGLNNELGFYAADIARGSVRIPSDCNAQSSVVTQGIAPEPVTVTVTTTVAGLAPVAVPATVEITTVGQPFDQGGTTILANGAPAVWTEVAPLGDIYMYGSANNLQALVIEGM